MKKLILIRGLPGGGKTTLASYLETHAQLKGETVRSYEADTWLVNDDGTYVFNRHTIQHAHKVCLSRARLAMDMSVTNVIVSNTFTQKKEIQPYIDAAKERGYKVIVYEAHGRFENIHNVPQEVIDRMRDRWYPTELLDY